MNSRTVRRNRKSNTAYWRCSRPINYFRLGNPVMPVRPFTPRPEDPDCKPKEQRPADAAEKAFLIHPLIPALHAAGAGWFVTWEHGGTTPHVFAVRLLYFAGRPT